MKIIEVVTDNISDIKTIIEILTGLIPEANADFIKDAKKYTEKFNKKKPIKNNESDDDDDEASNQKYEEDIEEDEEVEVLKKKKSDKTSNSKKKVGKNKNESNDTDDKSDIKQDEKTDDDSENDADNNKSTKKKVKGKKTKAKKDTKKTKPKKKENKRNDDNSDNEEVEDEDKKEENRGEIKILTADPNQVMLTFIILKGSAFKKFNVLPDKYSVGLNLDELYKYIKNVDKEGTMSIHIDSDDTQHIIFDVKSDNSNSHESICELRVLNLSSKKDRRIEANVAMAVRINCQAFHKACKDLLQFSQFVEITCDPTQFVITCKGDLSNHSRIFKANGTQNGIIIKTIKRDDDDAPNIIRLVFDLKYINSMYKCSSLCEDMEIYLNTDSVMFLKYGIKLMGEMLVGIAPSSKKKEQIDNYDENDDTFYQDDEEIQLK